MLKPLDPNFVTWVQENLGQTLASTAGSSASHAAAGSSASHALESDAKLFGEQPTADDLDVVVNDHMAASDDDYHVDSSDVELVTAATGASALVGLGLGAKCTAAAFCNSRTALSERPRLAFVCCQIRCACFCFLSSSCCANGFGTGLRASIRVPSSMAFHHALLTNLHLINTFIDSK